MTTHNKTLTFLLPNYGDGGLERMFVNLASEVSRRNIRVFFIVGDASRPYLGDLPSQVTLIQLHGRSQRQRIDELAQHLSEQQPDALLTAREQGLPIALAAKKCARSHTRIYFRAVTNLTASFSRRHFLTRLGWKFKLGKIRRWYHQVDGIIAVSQGIADDVQRISGVASKDIQIAHNPVVTKKMLELAEQPVQHPWFAPGMPPVILGVGRFTKQKNFELLIKAFAQVRKERQARLIILGKGTRKESFESLANELGVMADIELPGFTANPYAYLRKASLFVLSSNWEGSPNVLTEALAIGCPVVATDCPSGPRETLQDGKFGPLVPMDDINAMAIAIKQVLDNPLPSETLRSAARPFHVDASTNEYLMMMGLL